MPLSTQRLAAIRSSSARSTNACANWPTPCPTGRPTISASAATSSARPIELTLSEYESVRARPKSFFIIPGHERLEVEDVTDERDAYIVVEKIVRSTRRPRRRSPPQTRSGRS